MFSISCLNEATVYKAYSFFIFLECYLLIFKHTNTTPLRQRIFTEVLNVNSIHFTINSVDVCYSSTLACFSNWQDC